MVATSPRILRTLETHNGYLKMRVDVFSSLNTPSEKLPEHQPNEDVIFLLFLPRWVWGNLIEPLLARPGAGCG